MGALLLEASSFDIAGLTGWLNVTGSTGHGHALVRQKHSSPLFFRKKHHPPFRPDTSALAHHSFLAH